MLKLFQNGWATEYLVKEIFHTHKAYTNRRGRIPRTTTNSCGPQRPWPLHTRAREDEEPRHTRSDDRDDDDEALYEPAIEDEEPRPLQVHTSLRRQPLSLFNFAEDEDLGPFDLEYAEDTNRAPE